MTKLVRQLAERNAIRFGHPPYFGYHSYDRLAHHTPTPNLEMLEDGALIERFDDPMMSALNVQGHVLFRTPHFGREIMYFHFINTKKWPL